MEDLSIIESKILELIPTGTERKISISEISNLIDLDNRSIYETVNSLRKKGIPICAKRSGKPSDRGYFIATSEQEKAEGISAYKAQVNEMQQLIVLIEKADVNSWRNRTFSSAKEHI